MPCEEAIQKAIADVQNGVYTTTLAAAKANGIDITTLRRRIAGSVSRKTRGESQRRLTPPQERFLMDWIIDQHHLGCPPPHNRIRDMAQRILRMYGETTPIGMGWVSHFLKRCPIPEGVPNVKKRRRYDESTTDSRDGTAEVAVEEVSSVTRVLEAPTDLPPLLPDSEAERAADAEFLTDIHAYLVKRQVLMGNP